MTKTYEICETVRHWHLVTVDDEVNIEDVIKQCNDNLPRYDTGYEAIEDVLEDIKDRYGLEFEMKKNYCGTESEGLSVMDEVEII